MLENLFSFLWNKGFEGAAASKNATPEASGLLISRALVSTVGRSLELSLRPNILTKKGSVLLKILSKSELSALAGSVLLNVIVFSSLVSL